MDEIKELREEIAKLRERIAVLESKRAQWQYNPMQPSLIDRYQMPVVGSPINPQFVTHGSGVIC